MDLHKALQELAEEVKSEVMRRVWEEGVNPKTGTNTLIYSDLIKDMKVVPIENGIALQIADYWQFVARGWERTGNYPNTFHQFVKNLTKWVRKKNIRFGNLSQNQIVWVVLNKIWQGGIMPRPFMVYNDEGDLTEMIPELKSYMDKWFEELIDSIFEDINNYFNK